MNPLDPVIEQIQDKMRAYELYRRRGDAASSHSVIEEILRLYPDHPNALEAKADCLRDDGKIEEAKALYKQLINQYKGRVATEKKFADLIFRSEGSSAHIQQMLEEDKIGYLLSHSGAPRNRNTAAVFSLLVPGFGQIYNGELTRGLSFLAWEAISLLAFIIFGHQPGRVALTTIGYLSVASIALCSIVSIVDAYMGAPTGAETRTPEKKGRPKPPVDLPFE